MGYGDGKVREILLPVTGPVNTVDPSASRPPGTLLEAPGCGTQWWGPRKGSKYLASPHALTTKPTAAPRLLSSGDLTDPIVGRMAVGEQADLGTVWTFDCLFRFTSLPVNTTGIFQWHVGFATPIMALGVSLYGSGVGADAGKVSVNVVTTSSPGVGVSSVEVKTSVISVGSDDDDIHHLRVVRDGANLYVYIDGVLDGTSTALSATNPTQAATTETEALWAYQRDGGATATEQMWYAAMRTGVFRTVPISRLIPSVPLSNNCKLCVVFSRMSTVSTLQAYKYVPDLSRFQAHGYSPSSFDALTFAQDTSSHLHRPIQGLSRFVGVDGVHGNAVRCAGSLYWRGASGN